MSIGVGELVAAGRQDRLLYYAFHLLYLDGFDLRGAPLPLARANGGPDVNGGEKIGQ